MLELNGVKLAISDKEFTDSLFSNGGTCGGYYKVLKNKVKVFNMQNELSGVITKHGVMLRATKVEGGKYWYSHGDISNIGSYNSYGEEYDDIKTCLGLL